MVKSFFFYSTFVLTLVGAILADDPYIPCKSYIGFYYDDSETLRKDQFRVQMNFIKNAIGDLNYPQRIAAEGGYGGEFNWNSKLSIAQMQSAIDAAEQTSIPYSLLQQFSSLATNFENLNNFGDRFGVLIFISDTSDDALKNADRLFPKLKGIRITFVLLGNNVDSSKLRNFSSNFLYWPDLTQSAPDNWDLVSYHSYGCDAPYVSSSILPSTAPPATTPISTPKTTSIPNGGDYVPCQVLVTTLVDISNTLNIDYFQKQLTFTKIFLSQINHPERIRYGAYLQSNGNMTYPWSVTNSQGGLQQAIDNTHQQSQASSLSGAMRMLISNPNTNITIPDSSIIFVTDTTNSVQNQQALNLYNSSLRGRVKLTFILTGNKTDATALQGFNDAIFFNWQNMNTTQPDGWDISQALRCTPLTTAMPYIPCQSWISFNIDDSNTLNANDYNRQLNFIASAIGALNHPERIQAIGGYDQPVMWNNPFSIEQIQNIVKGMQQAGRYLLRNQFAALLTGLQTTQTNNIPVGALIFISDTSDDALYGASNTFSQLQNVQITFVLLGNNPDQNKLTQFSNNFITWRDLSRSQPDNWDQLSPPAYGCINGTSAWSTSSSVTRGGITVQTVPA